jgi:hypothetical protein
MQTPLGIRSEEDSIGAAFSWLAFQASQTSDHTGCGDLQLLTAALVVQARKKRLVYVFSVVIMTFGCMFGRIRT